MLSEIILTGSEYGLRLTLNIEDYEHVEGTGTKSGIKVHYIFFKLVYFSFEVV